MAVCKTLGHYMALLIFSVAGICLDGVFPDVISTSGHRGRICFFSVYNTSSLKRRFTEIKVGDDTQYPHLKAEDEHDGTDDEGLYMAIPISHKPEDKESEHPHHAYEKNAPPI